MYIELLSLVLKHWKQPIPSTWEQTNKIQAIQQLTRNEQDQYVLTWGALKDGGENGMTIMILFYRSPRNSEQFCAFYVARKNTQLYV